MRSRFWTCDGYDIHVTEWGTPGQPLVILWHGLARTGRDFDGLAAALADRYHVLCPDTIGRGLSQWARNREQDYCLATYSAIAVDLIDQVGARTVRWVGTSMGGLIGMRLAAEALAGRMTHLVINDVGPEIPAAAIDRIATYVGSPPIFDHVRALEDWFRTIYAPFGENSDTFWRTMATTSCRRLEDGRITVHYDPRIVSQFTAHTEDLDLWSAFTAIACPILLLRGADSDVLPASVAAAMVARGQDCDLVSRPGYGHAPTLTTPADQALIAEFLQR